MNNTMILIILGAAILMLLALMADSAYLFALSFPVLMFAWMFLGALRKGKIGKWYRLSLLSVLGVWICGFPAMNLMDTTVMPTIYFGGFPLPTAIMVYGVWILPFFLGSYAYGHFFESDCMSAEEFEDFLRDLKTIKHTVSSSHFSTASVTRTARGL